jgi:hypothetical protein
LSGPPVSTGFWTWYRRYYLLVNVPALLLVTELLLTVFDPVRHAPFRSKTDLDYAIERIDADPPKDAPVLLLLGNSGMRLGADQNVIQRALATPAHPLKVYNVGLNGVRVNDELAVVDLLIERGIKPRAAVLGVNLYFVDDRVVPDTLYPWITRRSPYIFFHRNRLYGGLKRLLKGVFKGEKVKPYDQFAEVIKTKKEMKTELRVFLEQFQPRQPGDFPLIEELPALIDGLAQRGIRPYVVIMPIRPSAAAALPQHDRILAAVKAALPPAALDETTRSYPDDMFGDIGHFNASGRAKFTAELVDWLRTKTELQAP